MNRKEEKFINQLQKRMNHLLERINAHPTKNLSFDAHEAAAIKWALKKIDSLQEDLELCEIALESIADTKNEDYDSSLAVVAVLKAKASRALSLLKGTYD